MTNKNKEKRGEEFFSPSDRIVKSNVLIGSKYRATLNELKLTALTLSRIPSAKLDAEGSLVVEMGASEIRDILNISPRSGGFYRTLSKTAQKMVGRVLGIDDPENKRFAFFPFISMAAYENSCLKVRFVPEMTKFLLNLSSNYSILSLSVMLQWRSSYAYRLYEILRSRCFYPKDVAKRDNKFRIWFSVSELKLEIGAINPNIGRVQDILRETGERGTPDWDRACEAAKDQVYKDWAIFKRDVLDKAIAEINSNDQASMHIEYTLHRGANRKVSGITFFVDTSKEHDGTGNPGEYTEVFTAKKDLTEDDKFIVIGQILEEIEEKISILDAKRIAEAAEYDMDKVRIAYSIAQASNTDIRNLVSWMVSAIEKSYKPPVKKAGKTKKNDFHNFDERDDDLDAIVAEEMRGRDGKKGKKK